MDKDTFTKEELKEALKKFKANRDDVQNPDQIRQKYRFVSSTSKSFGLVTVTSTATKCFKTGLFTHVLSCFCFVSFLQNNG